MSLLPRNGDWEIIGPSEQDNKAEFKTLDRLHQEGIANLYDVAWYFHTKGISRLSEPTKAWRRYMEHFLIDRWEEGLEALAGGWDAYGVEWMMRPSDRQRMIFAGNFWATRRDYVQCLSPMIYVDRHSCEDWIGYGNPRVRCCHWSQINLYETVYPEESYRAKR